MNTVIRSMKLTTAMKGVIVRFVQVFLISSVIAASLIVLAPVAEQFIITDNVVGERPNSDIFQPTKNSVCVYVSTTNDVELSCWDTTKPPKENNSSSDELTVML